VLILAAAGAVALARLLGLPASVGFLAAGITVGSHGLGILAPGEGTTFLSELGVVLLMFLGGLEFSLAEMVAARATVLRPGGLQVALTTSLTAIVAWFFGLGWPAAIVVGGVTTMSSTAVTLKQLSEQYELGAAHGRRRGHVVVSGSGSSSVSRPRRHGANRSLHSEPAAAARYRGNRSCGYSDLIYMAYAFTTYSSTIRWLLKNEPLSAIACRMMSMKRSRY
jgi:sodium/hydrogen exchanger family protein